ncbi:MAG: hypothetical protein IPK79_12675 [Vampirovibrionales bacterium]|nr:hypothetical protein [Vampirovibrionales bacterium]
MQNYRKASKKFPPQKKGDKSCRGLTGNTLAELACITVFIAIFCVAALTFLSNQFSSMCDYLGNFFANTIKNTSPGSPGSGTS